MTRVQINKMKYASLQKKAGACSHQCRDQISSAQIYGLGLIFAEVFGEV